MSLLAEVLSNSKKITLDEINNQVPKILVEVDKIKSETTHFLENLYVKELPETNKLQFENGRGVYDEINELQKNLKDVSKRGNKISDKDIEKYGTSLDKTSCEISIVSNILDIHKGLKTVSNFETEKLYLQSVIEINKLDKHVQSLSDIEELNEISNKFIATIITTKQSILLNCKNIFMDNVIINENNLHLSVKIKATNNEMEDVLKALYFNDESVKYLDYVTKCFWNKIFIPVVDFTTEIKITEETKENFLFNVVEIKIIDKSVKPPYNDVFNQLIKVLNFLKTNFDYKLNDTRTTLEYIGSNLRDNLSELIIKHCLENTIPSTKEGLQKYKTVISDTEELEKVLINSNIFAEDTTSILGYANNIDILFINKKCQEYFNQAQNIMKKDLHDIEEVGVPHNLSNPLQLDVNTFQRCSVSKNVNELIKLIEKILKTTLEVSDLCAGRLFCVVKKIFKTYTIFVPEYHKKLLQSIPQQVAVFYNNCLFLSFQITQWNKLYCEKLTPKLQIDLTAFNSDSILLDTVGSEIFHNYVDEQIKQIISIMKESGLQTQTQQVLDKLEPIAEKSVRQCIRQQELLKTVWGKVLSYTIFNQTIGYILHSFCNNLIDSIIKFEDIHSEAAEQLIEIIKIITTRGPKLFTDPKEINLYVSSWYKLNELVFVLSSSLLDINDRWADGKGTLAMQFKPEELKRLIRALFQNTDRRAAVLTKIQ